MRITIKIHTDAPRPDDMRKLTDTILETVADLVRYGELHRSPFTFGTKTANGSRFAAVVIEGD